MQGFNVYVGRKRFAEAVPIDGVYCNYISGMFLHCLLKKQANNPYPSPQFSLKIFSLMHSTFFICYMGEKNNSIYYIHVLFCAHIPVFFKEYLYIFIYLNVHKILLHVIYGG